jgi:hypothetical protein
MPIGYICGSLDGLGQATEEAVHQAALLELLLELGLVVAAALHLPEDLDDREQDHDVERRDEVQEGP